MTDMDSLGQEPTAPRDGQPAESAPADIHATATTPPTEATATPPANETPTEATPPRHGKPKGRPVLGAVSGLLFGIFLALLLQQFAVRPLDNLSVIGLPILGLAAGIGLALWAPLGRRRRAAG